MAGRKQYGVDEESLGGASTDDTFEPHICCTQALALVKEVLSTIATVGGFINSRQEGSVLPTSAASK